MFKKKESVDVFLDEPQDQDKKSTKKIIIDIIGIVLVILVIIGTYLVIVFREEIIAAIPIIRDENGKIVVKKEKKNTSSRDLEKLTAPISSGIGKEIRGLKIEGSDYSVEDDGLKFKITITPLGYKKEASILTIDRIAVDGYVFSNHYEVEIKPSTSSTQEITIDKLELEKYSIIRPNVITFYTFNSANPDKKIPEIASITLNYNTPMDNKIKGLIPIGEISNLAFYFYKQDTDMENTYLYFNINNKSSSERHKIKVKKLVVNDKIIDASDFEEESYFLSEKLFYIKIPRKTIANVEKFSVSFFVIMNENEKNESIYITKEYTHEE